MDSVMKRAIHSAEFSRSREQFLLTAHAAFIDLVKHFTASGLKPEDAIVTAQKVVDASPIGKELKK